MWKRAFFQDHAAKFFSAFANVSFGRLVSPVIFIRVVHGWFFAVAENGLLSFQPLLYAFTEK